MPEVFLVDQGATSLDVALEEDDLDEELELELELELDLAKAIDIFD